MSTPDDLPEGTVLPEGAEPNVSELPASVRGEHADTGVGWPPADADVAEPENPAEPASTARRKRLSAAGAIIGLLVGLLGFALVTQIHSNTGDTQLENAREDDLVRILSDLNSREDRLRAEISNLEQTSAKLSSTAQGREAALAEARRRADELGILSGTLAAQGPGLKIQFVPGGDKPIHAATVLEAIEELRGAGAEAMQIGGANGVSVRIVASTYFIDTGGGINVDGQTLTGTYTVTVIGPAQTMRTALTIPGGVADSVARDGGSVIVDEPATVLVDTLHPAEPLQYAQPTQ
jgi:uncharacterized protein YlxW (UPF0749 family)